MNIPKTFTEALTQFKTAQTRHNSLAQICAVMALTQFTVDGNLDPAKQFREVLDTSAKQNAFSKWMGDMSNKCVQFADKKFTKRDDATDERMAAIDLVKARDTKMLTYKQVPVDTTYNVDDVQSKVEGAFNRFLTGKRMSAVDAETRTWVEARLSEVKAIFTANPYTAAVEAEEAAPASTS